MAEESFEALKKELLDGVQKMREILDKLENFVEKAEKSKSEIIGLTKEIKSLSKDIVKKAVKLTKTSPAEKETSE